MPSAKEFIQDVATDMLAFVQKDKPIRPMQIEVLIEAGERMRRALRVAEDKAPPRDEVGNVIFETAPEFQERIQRINQFGGHASDWAREMSLEFNIPIEKYHKVCAFLEDFAATKILCQPEAHRARAAVIFAVEPAETAETAGNTSRVDTAASEETDLVTRCGADAYKWAAEFAIMYGLISNEKGNEKTFDRRSTHEIMLGWFANAMVAYSSNVEQKHAADTLELRERNDRQAETIGKFQVQTGMVSSDGVHQSSYSRGMTDRDPEIKALQNQLKCSEQQTERLLASNRQLGEQLLGNEQTLGALRDQLANSGYSQGHQEGYKKGYSAGIKYHEGHVKDVILAGGILGEGASVIVGPPSNQLGVGSAPRVLNAGEDRARGYGPKGDKASHS